MLLLLFIVVVGVAVLLFLRRNIRTPFWPGGAARLSGDAILPYVGSGLEFTINGAGLYERGYRERDSHGSFAFTRFGMQWTAVSDPRDLEKILRLPNFDFSKAYGHFLDKFWPKIFPFVSRVESFTHVLLRTPVLNDVASSFKDMLILRDPFRQLNGARWNLFQTNFKLAFRAHAVAMLGKRLESKIDQFDKLYFDANPESAMLSPVSMVKLLLFGVDAPFQRMVDFMDEILTAEIEAAGGEEAYAKTDSPGSLMQSFYSYFYQNGLPSGSPPNIRSEVCCCVWGVLMASILNTASAASWMLYHISRDAKIIDRVRAEVVSAFGENSNPREWVVDANFSTQKTPYLKRCVGEAIRLHQHATVFRMALEDFVLPSGVAVKEGTIVTYHSDITYFNEKLFENPLVFDPDRSRENMSHWGYLPWGRGAHPCTGQRIAETDICMFAAYMFSQYDVTVHDEPVRDYLQMGSIAQPKNVMYASVKPRINT